MIRTEDKSSWEIELDKSKVDVDRKYDFDSLFERTHQELSLQQSKRDQIITIYLALCSFIMPFVLGEDYIKTQMKGIIFIVVAIIGVLFSLIAIRYREYKEVYWLCCQSITVLQNFKSEEINKDLIQRTFFHCLHKKGKKTASMSFVQYAKANIFSAETMHFIIIDLMTSFIAALGIIMLLEDLAKIKIVIGIIGALIIFVVQLFYYFYVCRKVYSVIKMINQNQEIKKREDAFNRVFKKAWFLHMYIE